VVSATQPELCCRRRGLGYNIYLAAIFTCARTVIDSLRM
jgi:hypothetical protein